MTAKARATRKTPAPKTPTCDNHPDRDARFQTTSGGRHSLISLCDACVPQHWRTV